MLIPHCSHTLKALLLDIGVTLSLVGLKVPMAKKKKKDFIYLCLLIRTVSNSPSFFVLNKKRPFMNHI